MADFAAALFATFFAPFFRPAATCDDLGVEADKRTLTPEDFARVIDLLKFRPMQLAIVLKRLVGVEEMQRLMVEAVGVAKRQE